jgi:ribosomal protein L15
MSLPSFSMNNDHWVRARSLRKEDEDRTRKGRRQDEDSGGRGRRGVGARSASSMSLPSFSMNNDHWVRKAGVEGETVREAPRQCHCHRLKKVWRRRDGGRRGCTVDVGS